MGAHVVGEVLLPFLTQATEVLPFIREAGGGQLLDGRFGVGPPGRPIVVAARDLRQRVAVVQHSTVLDRQHPRRARDERVVDATAVAGQRPVGPKVRIAGPLGQERQLDLARALQAAQLRGLLSEKRHRRR